MRTLDSQLLIFSVSFQNPLIIIETCNLQICFYLVLENLMELSTKEKRERKCYFFEIMKMNRCLLKTLCEKSLVVRG